jgi:hypothetical protein
MTVAADPPLMASFRQILTSNEILSREALFKRKYTEAIGVQNWLFRLLGTVNLLVLAVGVFSGLILAVAIGRSLLPGWAIELQSATTIPGVAITAFTILATTLGQFRAGRRPAGTLPNPPLRSGGRPRIEVCSARSPCSSCWDGAGA